MDRLGSLVPRPRLLDRLDGVPAGGVGLVVAPAGSGKSVLLDQWTAHVRSQGRRVAVVRADARSRDQVVLAHRLVEALASAVPSWDVGLEDLASAASGRLGRAFVDRLLVELGGLDAPVDVVLDDAHLLGPLPELAAEATQLLAELPSTVRILLGARWDPDLGLHRLRVEGRLVEVRTADLAFDVAEAAAFADSFADVSLAPDLVEALVARTDGWAVGLQLACISLAGDDDPVAFIEDFRGSDLLVAEYLTREALDRCKPEQRSFLLASAVLPWLSVELCAAALDGLDAATARDRLDELVHGALFVIPLDRHGRRFRYHHLFADLLAYQLRIEHPATEAAVRRRAAGWLEAAGHVADAAEQLLALGDDAGLLALVRRHGHAFFARSETATLRSWLDRAAAAAPRPSVELLIDRLAAQMAAHETSAVLESHRRLVRRHDLTHGQRAAVEALYACAGLDDLPTDEVERAATAAEEHLARAAEAGEEVTDFLGIGGRPSCEAMAVYMRAVVRLHRLDLAGAAATLERALALDGMAYGLWKCQALGTLALVRALTGRHSAAVADAAASIRLGEELGSRYHHATTHAHVALALVGLDRLELDLAASHVAEARVRAERSGWIVDGALAQVVAAHLAAARRGPTVALGELVAAAPPVDLPTFVTCTMAATRARLLARLDQGQRALDERRACPAGPTRWAAEVDVALAAGDLAAAGAVLAGWDAADAPREAVGRTVRAAAVAAAAGDAAGAAELLGQALDVARTEEIRAPFVEVPGVVALLRREPRLAADPFARSVVEAGTGLDRRDRATASLAEPLTDRELEVLPYLPTRLSNAEVARALYVSVNTVKTHLRHIYLKLGVNDRDEAVARATELGLL